MFVAANTWRLQICVISYVVPGWQARGLSLTVYLHEHSMVVLDRLDSTSTLRILPTQNVCLFGVLQNKLLLVFLSQYEARPSFAGNTTKKTVPHLFPTCLQQVGVHHQRGVKHKIKVGHGLFTSLSLRVLRWIQTYLCLQSINLQRRMRAFINSGSKSFLD